MSSNPELEGCSSCSSVAFLRALRFSLNFNAGGRVFKYDNCLSDISVLPARPGTFGYPLDDISRVQAGRGTTVRRIVPRENRDGHRAGVYSTLTLSWWRTLPAVSACLPKKLS